MSVSGGRRSSERGLGTRQRRGPHGELGTPANITSLQRTVAAEDRQSEHAADHPAAATGSPNPRQAGALSPKPLNARASLIFDLQTSLV